MKFIDTEDRVFYSIVFYTIVAVLLVMSFHWSALEADIKAIEKGYIQKIDKNTGQPVWIEP